MQYTNKFLVFILCACVIIFIIVLAVGIFILDFSWEAHLVLVLIFIAIAHFISKFERKNSELMIGYCNRCGYNLRGLSNLQRHCPECGEKIKWEKDTIERYHQMKDLEESPSSKSTDEILSPQKPIEHE
ncbi:MAG: hypothetical protein KTR15_07990 [Phycisphaeraceae bacterium]|nr:hypothetical protein [Phycisphaeraceae bacterium]